MPGYPAQCNCIRPKECTNIKVIAFGNVLVSYTAYLEDTKLLDRYKLSLNDVSEMDADTFAEVTAEIIVNKEQHEPKLGGSGMRTVCMLKYMGTEPLFFGACGEDKQSEIIYELLKNLNMDRSHFRLQTIPDKITDRQISLIHNDSLSSYTCNGASFEFTGGYLQHIDQEEHSSFLRPPNRKQIIYIEGFFIPKREAATTFIVRQYVKGRRYLAVNLSADYIVRLNFAHMLFLINNALFIFGNKAEFETLRECWGASSIWELAKGLIGESKTLKILVMTKGAEGVELITNYVREKSSADQLSIQTFKVTAIENVIDTSGCGDVFAGAFLHSWLVKHSLSKCVRVGIHRATKYIKNNCCLPVDAPQNDPETTDDAV